MAEKGKDIERQLHKQVKEYIKSSEELKKIGWGECVLRPYQLDGVNWMIQRYKKGHGCILGDEMGLGKTCQTIAVIAYIHKTDNKKGCPNLVVCPRSVLENWGQEIKRFAPGLKTKVLIGNKEERQEEAKQIRSDFKRGKIDFDILLTTYEICLKDSPFLQRIEWNLLVVDEAHRLKNINSLLYKTLTEWDTKTPILLTGTPVQNNLQELYALLSFISSEKFPVDDLDEFVHKYSKGKLKVSELHNLLEPYLLRRTKTAVLKDLPGKTEVVVTHGISKLQTKLYKGILMKDPDVFDSTGAGSYTKQTNSLMNILMQLRKCVNHPYLFDGVEPEPFQLGEHLVEASGKLVLIDKMLKYLKATGHKVLMFSQMTHMLDILQDYLGYRGYTYERLDGSVRGEERFLAVQNFNTNDETFVFLLSTRAGLLQFMEMTNNVQNDVITCGTHVIGVLFGLAAPFSFPEHDSQLCSSHDDSGQGINLTSADTVIFVDSDFNPQNDLQAAARAHRIGQTRPVKIIRLIANNTVEEIILKRAQEKLKLTEKVIEEGQFSLGASKQGMFTDDKIKLQDILKFGVDELFSEKDDEELSVDFIKMLGPTVDGEWLEEEIDQDSGTEDTEEAMEEEIPQTMYMFEGKDYSQEPTAADIKAFDDLVQAEKAIITSKLAADRPSRIRKQATVFAGLPDVLRKPRKKLTPEELEERNRKRKENAERRAKEAEEQEIRKAQELRKRREEMWKKNNYESLNIASDIEDENYDEADLDEDMGGFDEDARRTRGIQYTIGDVTQPKSTDRENNIIIHCTDDSGSWGRGGLFTAISTRSTVPEKHYELAGKMQDLALGDCHLIPFSDCDSDTDGKPKSDKNSDWLGLIVAQHRDKRNRLSGIKLSALRYGLEKVYKAAKDKNASVHLPRIGYDTPGFNWYGTERLIKKHLASKGIPTYIYYFPRKQNLKRKQTVADISDKRRNSSDIQPSTSTSRSSSSKQGSQSELLDIFTGHVIYIDKDGMTEADYKYYKRYIIAFNGDIDCTVTDKTTQIVVPTTCNQQAVMKLSESNTDIPIVTTEWIDDCLIKRKLVKAENYEIS